MKKYNTLGKSKKQNKNKPPADNADKKLNIDKELEDLINRNESLKIGITKIVNDILKKPNNSK